MLPTVLNSQTRAEVGAQLRKKLKSRSIKLPSGIVFEEGRNGLLLRLNQKAVTMNMQTDDSAFEGWALALHLWLEKNVTLDWEVPAETADGHYERFLYRAAQFQTLFPEWFALVDAQRLEISKALHASDRVLNVATPGRDPVGKERYREDQLERRLIQSERFHAHFDLECSDRQFPVGLFAEKVSKRTLIFTAGASAIDIVGAGRDGSFHLFELKARGNAKVGIVSEFLCYTGLMREAAHARIRFKSDLPFCRRVRECTAIHGVMLVEDLHPLLRHPELVNTLDRAAAEHWNREPGAKPVDFRLALVRECE